MSKLGQSKIPLKCPKCNRSIDPTVQTIYSNRHLKCSCGSEREIGMSEASGLRQAVQKLDAATTALQMAAEKKESAEDDFKEALTHALSKATIHIKP